MSIPHKFHGLWPNRLLAATIVVLVVAHVGVASIRHPVGPQFGTEVSGQLPDQALKQDQLRVAAYNIRRGKGLDGKRDLDRIAQNLSDFDVIGLNEVGGDWTGNQAQELGEGLGMGWLFAPAQRRWYTDYFGNGLLTRISPATWLSLPMIYDLEKGTGHRNILFVEMTWRDIPVTIMIVHAERGEIRDAQIRHIFGEFSKFEHAILLGDLNAAADEPIMQIMMETYEAASSTGPDQVDWIFIRGLSLVENGSLPAGASDHPLMWATLRRGDEGSDGI